VQRRPCAGCAARKKAQCGSCSGADMRRRFSEGIPKGDLRGKV
jgi:hypothetical protein